MKNLNSTDWRARRMARIRELIKQADPDIQEEVKYKTPSNPDGVFVWYKNGMLTTGETYKNHLRFTFSKGPVLKEWDGKSLINSYRSMIIHENDELDESAFKQLIKDAVALNQSKKNN